MPFTPPATSVGGGEFEMVAHFGGHGLGLLCDGLCIWSTGVMPEWSVLSLVFCCGPLAPCRVSGFQWHAGSGPRGYFLPAEVSRVGVRDAPDMSIFSGRAYSRACSPSGHVFVVFYSIHWAGCMAGGEGDV